MKYTSLNKDDKAAAVRGFANAIMSGRTLVWHGEFETRSISLAIIHDMMKSDREIVDRIFAMADNKHELKDYIDNQAAQYALEDVRAALEEFNAIPEGL